MRLSDYTTLTFDCYGTLIDWEAGILAGLAGWRARTGIDADDGALIEAFARHETVVQQEHSRAVYPEILARVLERIGVELGAPASAEEQAAFGRSVGDWPPFADSVEALAALKRRYRLMVLSNIDPASFKPANDKLGVAFDAVITAHEVGAYKPDPLMFEALLTRLREDGVDPRTVLHTAQSLYHDARPAKAAGLTTCWIKRYGGKAGAAPEADVTPDMAFDSLAGLAEAAERAFANG